MYLLLALMPYLSNERFQIRSIGMIFLICCLANYVRIFWYFYAIANIAVPSRQDRHRPDKIDK